jgi:NAD(P)-dependent dehydrogenase (short-subunit alcohol dehydrogenase family)
MASDRFKNKVALIAGGASGIGAATTEAFAANGAAVVIGDIQDDLGEALAQQIRDGGGRAVYVHADCTKAADVERFVARAISEFGGLHLAANVLGGAHKEDVSGNTIHTTTEDVWRGTMAISLDSIFLLMQQELIHMMANGGGAIVNVSSMAAVAADKHATLAYGVAKAGLNHLTQWAAADYAKYDIRVNAILPGTTATPLLRRLFTPEQVKEMCANQHAIARAVEPEEQANAIVWLASDEAAMITGVLLPVDGGRSAFGLQGPPASAVARNLIG